MGVTMAEQTKDVRVVDMLTILGIITPTQLSEVERLASEAELSLGRALVVYGYVPQDDLNTALELQSLVKYRELPLPTAAKAFRLLKTKQANNLAEALQKAGFSGSLIAHSASRLGTMLVDANLITAEQLELAQRASYETAQPSGRILVLMQVITQDQLNKALEVQKLVREERMSYEEALRALNPDPNSPAAASEAVTISLGRPLEKKIRLGELLIHSRIVTENDIMNALELGLTKQKPIGVILIEMGMLTQSLLDLALNIQGLVCDGTLALNSATDTLYSYAITGKIESETAALQNQSPTVRLGELLQMSGLVNNNDIEQAISLSSKYPSVIGKMLVIAGVITDATLLAALRCQFLLKHGLITIEQAIEALRHAELHRMSVDDSLDVLGYNVNG